MSRAFTRVLVLSTIGGLAAAPSLAYAAGGGSNPHAPTVTRVLAPKHAHGGKDILLSARVSEASKPTAPTTDLEPDSKGSKGGKGRGHRRASESGTVVFTVDGKAQTPVRISQGRALEKLTLPPGNHTATASYSGDDNYGPSQSAPVTFTVS
jgi:hypothetical protein